MKKYHLKLNGNEMLLLIQYLECHIFWEDASEKWHEEMEELIEKLEKQWGEQQR